MTNIALQKPFDQTLLKRFAHGGGALIATLGLFLVLALAADAMIGPKLDLLASLKTRAQSIEALETALENQQTALSENLYLIDASIDDGPASLSSAQTLETLAHDADALISALEAIGFSLSNRTEATERAITPSLAVYATTLSFTGETQAAAALMIKPIGIDAHVKGASLTSDGQQGVNLSFTIQRIGAAAVIENGGGDE